MIKNILIAAAIGASALSAQAAGVTNGSFESAVIGGSNAGDYCYTALTSACSASGWDVSLLINSGSGAWGNPSANNSTGIDLGGVVAGLQGNGTLTSSADITTGYTYTLTWDDAGRSGYAAQSYEVTVGGKTYTFATNPGQDWAEHSVTFTAGSAEALSFAGQVTVDGTAFIDNVSLSVVSVPEPANVLLMLVGALSLVAYRRRSQI